MIQEMEQASPRVWTAADLVERERYEVIGGELVEKASPAACHSHAQGHIIGSLHGLGRQGSSSGAGGWWILPEVTVELFMNEIYQPDIAGWRREHMRVLPGGFPVCIAPDWVCEVLSPSTAGRDLDVKLRGYHRALVKHYWLVDPQARTLRVLRWEEGGYALALAAGAGDVVQPEPFPTIELSLAAVFGLA